MPRRKSPRIPLPKSWKGHVRSAILHVIALAQYAAVYTRSWAVDSMYGRVRLKAENDRLLKELAQRNRAMIAWICVWMVTSRGTRQALFRITTL